MSASANPKYSIVIAPPQAGIDYGAQLKDELNSKIGWYNSRNSKAHVTIIEFTADEDELVKIIAHLKEVASYEQPIDLSFDGVSSYPNGAVFLKPDEATKLLLTDLMINIQKKLNIKNSYKSKDPHISIGRKLSDENVEIALQLFANAKLDFYCTHLILRKFNPDRKQYDYFSEDFRFLGVEPKPEAQQSLF
jgi:2'-5' RNA ligase